MSEQDSDREGDLPHPRERTDLFGHVTAERALAQSYAEGRVPPAWLIGGPRGLGKATLAYRFARILLSGTKIDPQAALPLQMASTHPIFRLVAAQAHPDLMVLRRPYDEKAKRLKANIPLRPSRRRRRLPGLHRRCGRFAERQCRQRLAQDLGRATRTQRLPPHRPCARPPLTHHPLALPQAHLESAR
jgi:hypothetical protein